MTHVPWHESDLEKGEELHGVESVELISVGIDIGTTTTHLMFSRLLARRGGDEYSSKFHVVERDVIYESPIILTPYESGTTIDTGAIEAFLDEIYSDAGYTPDDIDTGAVIVTGEASRKANAEAIANLFSERAGKFVCATAGANLEALMSAHGSGAVDYSVANDERVLHIDIGGGTTKLAFIQGGFVEETASINLGARLVEFDGRGRVVRTEDAAQRVADHLGIDLRIGGKSTIDERQRLADTFAEVLFELVTGRLSQLGTSLMVTDVPDRHEFDVFTFAGGGAEFVYDRNTAEYNDLGKELGRAIQSQIESAGYQVAELDSGIRATALGSNQHSVQVSGNTILTTNRDVLPLRNVPMVPFVAHDHDDPEAFKAEIKEQLELYDIDQKEQTFAFGFHVHGFPNQQFLQMITDACLEGWTEFDGAHPMVLAFDMDIAMNAGRMVEDEIDHPVIAIDGVELDQFGYIDIGEPLEETDAVPLTIKSLLFEG